MVRRFALASLLVPLVAGLIGVGAGAASASKPEVQKTNHGHEYPIKGSKNAGSRSGSSNLINHLGPVLSTSSQVTAIFWGSSWSGSSFVGDKVSGLDSFYQGWSGSGYSTTTTEYPGPGGALVSGSVTYNGHAFDYSTGPTSPPSTAQIANEVLKVVGTPVAGGYYPVYVDLKRGSAGYCAWHDTYTTGNSVQFEVAFFFNLDNDAGCNPNDTWTTHSEPLAALANVSGHELSEAKTDPQLTAWFDRQGAENADKCAWHFNKVSNFPSNKTSWKIQGNWSNNANNNQTGYYKYGCIDGN